MSWIKDIFGSPDADSIAKANVSGTAPKSPPKAWNISPSTDAYTVNDMAETSWNLHPGTIGMDYYTLLSVSRIPIIGAILQTRIQQVAEFAVPQSNPYTSGFKIALRDHKAKMSRAAEREAKDITSMLLDAGGKYGFGGFEPSIRALMRDSLVYDQANFEVLHNRRGEIAGWIPTDATTIRKARPSQKDRERGRFDPKKYEFVQVIDDDVVNEFTREEMAWGIRRPRTWIQVSRYGYPELEELVRVITDLLNAQSWNSVNFTNGIHANTILTLKSAMSAEVFTAFKRHITAMMHGVRNAHRVPIIQLSPEYNEELSKVDMAHSARDMEYSTWLNFLIKLVCAVYTMDPAELGFVFGNEGQTNSLSTGSPQARIVSSKERGLRPLLRSLQSWMNHSLIYPANDDFQLIFVGMDVLGEQERIQLDIQSLKAFKTVNEIRAAHDLPPLDTDVANMVLDPTYINTAMQEKMGGQQPEAGGGLEEGANEQAPVDGFAQETADVDPNNLDELTQTLARSTQNAIDDGRIIRKGPHTGKKRSAFVRGEGGKYGLIVEVD